MKWWARRRLRARIFLPFSALILATLLTTLWLVSSAVSRQVEESLRAQLVVTGQVFQGRVRERGENLVANTSLLAADFALKRAIATYDPETLQSVALNYRRRVGTDAVWITDERGVVLAALGVGKEQAVGDAPPLAKTLESAQPAVAINQVEGTLFELVSVPVLAPDPIGFLLVGDRIDDEAARQLRQETGSEISFVTAAEVYASSWPVDERNLLFPDGRPSRIFPAADRPTFLARLGEERLLSILVPIEATLSEPLFALVQRSFDQALAPVHALRRRVALIGVLALLGALLVGALLAAGIAAPLRALVGAMRDVLTGNFRRRLRVVREDEIGFLAESFNEMVEGLEERERIKDTFGRFVSRDVAAAVLEGRVSMQGERREVTTLFQDTRDFTSIAAHTDPEKLVRMVNHLFTEMVAAVEAEGGIIKEFTGDGVMALFGAPVAHDDDPDRAVRAALAMLRRLPGLNAALARDGLPELRIGIGIHTGEVVAGRIGPDERVVYTVIGDPVNVASRIEGLTKETGTPLLASASTVARLQRQYRFGRRFVVPVRGKDQPVEVVEIIEAEGVSSVD
jgi:adenylate cyclase